MSNLQSGILEWKEDISGKVGETQTQVKSGIQLIFQKGTKNISLQHFIKKILTCQREVERNV